MDLTPIRGDDLVIVREDVPETAADQLPNLPLRVNRLVVPPRPDLLGGMVHGDEGRPRPVPGRELGDNVLAREAAREQPPKDGHALTFRKLLAAV